MRYHYTAIEWPKSGTPTTTNADKGLEQQEISFIAGGNAKQYDSFGRQAVSYKIKQYSLTIWSNNHAP